MRPENHTIFLSLNCDNWQKGSLISMLISQGGAGTTVIKKDNCLNKTGCLYYTTCAANKYNVLSSSVLTFLRI